MLDEEFSQLSPEDEDLEETEDEDTVDEDDEEEVDEALDSIFAASESDEDDDFEGGESEETVIYSPDQKPGELLEDTLTEEPEEEAEEEAEESYDDSSEEEEEEEVEEEVSEDDVEEESLEVEAEEEVVDEIQQEESVEEPAAVIPGPQTAVSAIPMYLANRVGGELESIEDLMSKLKGFEGVNMVFIISEDGLIISSDTGDSDIDINKFAALFAEIQQKENEMASLLSAEDVQEGTATLGGLKTFFIKDNYGYLVLAGEAFIHSPSIIPIMRFLSEKVKTNGIL